MQEKNKIINLYVEKSINVNNMDGKDILPWLVGFNFEDTKYLLSLLNEEQIKIITTEVFRDGNYYGGKEFFYKEDSLSDEYYNLLKDFIDYYDNINNNDLQFIIKIEDEHLNEEIKTNLRVKFSPKLSIKEIAERKKRGFEFTE